LKKTDRRLEVFNADKGMVRSPISIEEVQALGYNDPDDAFRLLQGDIVITESAYFLGERVTRKPKYIVLNSSCDLVPKRRQCSALLRIKEIREAHERGHQTRSELLKFTKRDAMYLPVLPFDDDDVLCNAIDFDGICQIRSDDLQLANRVASLTLVGWRMFASFSRTVIARASERETRIREAIELGPSQQQLPLEGPGSPV